MTAQAQIANGRRTNLLTGRYHRAARLGAIPITEPQELMIVEIATGRRTDPTIGKLKAENGTIPVMEDQIGQSVQTETLNILRLLLICPLHLRCLLILRLRLRFLQ